MCEGEEKAWKVSAEGSYKRFLGLTFISMLTGSQEALLPSLKSLLAEIASWPGYAVLPLESLHVTIKNHETATHLGLEEAEYLEQKILEFGKLQTMRQTCIDMAFSPRASMSHLEIGSTVRIVVNLLDDPLPLMNRLTELGSRPEVNVVFHVTLAYRCNLDTAPETSRLQGMFDLTLRNERMSFEECRLCYFNSMERFTPL